MLKWHILSLGGDGEWGGGGDRKQMTFKWMDMLCISASFIFSSFVLLGSGARNTVSASEGDEVISFCKKTNVQLFLERLSSEK